MNHVALNGTGPDNRHLDHQIIETARAHARQKVHLRAAFHLKHPDAVGLAEHVVDCRILGRQRCKRMGVAVVLAQQIKGLADTGQHPQRQHIDLQDAKAVDIVFVPTDNGPILHRGVFDGHKFIEPAFGHDEPAHVLRQVTGKADDLIDQIHRLDQPAVGRVQPDFAHPLGFQPLGREKSPKLGTECADGILTQPHGGPDLTNGALATVVDDGCAQARAVTAVAVIDVLDHLFSAFVFEIHVDIGRLVTGLGHEAFEHHGADFGADAGDAKAIADHGIGRRAAALTEDAAITGKGHDVAHGQEIGFVFQLGDQGQFVFQHGANPFRCAVRVAPFQPRTGEARQPVAGAFALGHLGRVFVAQAAQIELALIGQRLGAGDGIGVGAKDAAHFAFAAQTLFAIGQRVAPQLIDAAPQTHSSQYIRQPAPRAVVHQRTGGGDGGDVQVFGEFCVGGQTLGILPVIDRAKREVDLPGKAARQPFRLCQPSPRAAR